MYILWIGCKSVLSSSLFNSTKSPLAFIPQHTYYCITFTIVSLLLLYHFYYCITFTIVSLLLLYHFYNCITFTIVSLLLLYHFYYFITFTIVSLLLLYHFYYCITFTIVSLIYKAIRSQMTIYYIQKMLVCIYCY